VSRVRALRTATRDRVAAASATTAAGVTAARRSAAMASSSAPRRTALGSSGSAVGARVSRAPSACASTERARGSPSTSTLSSAVALVRLVSAPSSAVADLSLRAAAVVLTLALPIALVDVLGAVVGAVPVLVRARAALSAASKCAGACTALSVAACNAMRICDTTRASHAHTRAMPRAHVSRRLPVPVLGHEVGVDALQRQTQRGRVVGRHRLRAPSATSTQHAIAPFSLERTRQSRRATAETVPCDASATRAFSILRAPPQTTHRLQFSEQVKETWVVVRQHDKLHGVAWQRAQERARLIAT
jgi:hypothetical protein